MENIKETPDPSLDSIDHLNIYSKAATKLGRFLTNPTLFTFYFPPLKRHFKSIEHLWFYLSTKDERILDLKSPWDIKPFIRQNKIKSYHNPMFKSLIVQAMCYKIHQSDRDIFTAFITKQLPFKHYYFYGDRNNAKVYEQPKHDWQVIAWEKIYETLLKKSDRCLEELLMIAKEFEE